MRHEIWAQVWLCFEVTDVICETVAWSHPYCLLDYHGNILRLGHPSRNLATCAILHQTFGDNFSTPAQLMLWMLMPRAPSPSWQPSVSYKDVLLCCHSMIHRIAYTEASRSGFPDADGCAECWVWQIYMDRLGDLLSKRQDNSNDAEITKLAGQVCMATYLKGVFKPESMREVLSINKLGLSLEERKQVWSRVLRALKLSEEQCEQMLHLRRLFMPTQCQLLRTRQQLMTSLQVPKQLLLGACHSSSRLPLRQMSK